MTPEMLNVLLEYIDERIYELARIDIDETSTARVKLQDKLREMVKSSDRPSKGE
jgi:hypothetical protein